METQEIDKIFGSEQHREWLMTMLKLHGITQVLVDFAGSGDSGSIESVTATDTAGNFVDLKAHSMGWPDNTDAWNEETKSWEEDSSVRIKSLEDVIEEVTYNALEVSGLDWYNNDGGQGMFYIDLKETPPKIRLDIGINQTTMDDYTFFDDEDDESEEENAPNTP